MNSKLSYFEGDYESASKGKNDLVSISYKIAGLVFTGQHQEARLLAKSYEGKLSQDSLAVAYFHLGLSYTRTSDYSKAQEYFVKNLYLVRNENLSNESQFFAYQGASFFRFFFSCHKKSQELAEKGYRALLELENPPSLLLGLSLDIQAHNLIQLGHFNRGIKVFEKALDVTKRSKLTDLFSEIEISHLLYQSEFDPDLMKHSDSLQKYLKRSKNKNDYSKSEIVLQIAKILFLMGRFQDSNNFLNQHFDIVYKNQNKRKIALLNTLMAQIVMQKGQYLEALSIISVALSQLNPSVDKSLYLPLLGLKIKALKYLGQPAQDEIEESKLVALKVDRTINKNIQDRLNGDLQSRKIGDDKIADIMDRVKKEDLTVIKDLLRHQFLYPVLELYRLTPGKQYIVFLEKTGTILLVSNSAIKNVGKGFTKTQVKLLNCLSEDSQSKEELISKVWGYDYDPLRHDSLIYTSIARLRKILSPFGQWIHADEDSYSLDSNVEISTPEGLEEKLVKKSEAPSVKIKTQDLNHRQLSFLAEGLIFLLVLASMGKSGKSQG
jgi:tetratricopeptide (TPR) repeat protein